MDCEKYNECRMFARNYIIEWSNRDKGKYIVLVNKKCRELLIAIAKLIDKHYINNDWEIYVEECISRGSVNREKIEKYIDIEFVSYELMFILLFEMTYKLKNAAEFNERMIREYFENVIRNYDEFQDDVIWITRQRRVLSTCE